MSSDSGDGGGGELADEHADALLDQLVERADERDDIDLQAGSKRAISRRSLLGAVGAAGVGALAVGSSQNAEAQTGQWGNATGQAGTEQNPFSEGWVRDLHAETGTVGELSADNLNNAIDSESVGSLQTAVDNASPGQTILVSGNHQESVRVRTPDLTLLDWGGKVTTPDNSTEQDDDAAIRLFADGVSVIGVEIDGNRDNNTGKTFTESRYADGVAVYANDCVVSRCDIYDTVGHGIIVWNESFPNEVTAGPRDNCKLVNNTVERCEQRSGIDIASTDTGAELNNDILIHGNTVIGESGGDANQLGITTHTAREVLISNNNIRQVQRGFNLHSGCDNLYLINNHVTNMRERGMRINDSDNVTVIGGRIDDTADDGIRLELSLNSITIDSIRFTGVDGGNVIRAPDPGETITNLTVSNCEMEKSQGTGGNGSAMSLSTPIVESQFKDNIIRDCNTSGIIMVDGTDVDIANNHFQNISSIGADIQSASGFVKVDNNTIDSASTAIRIGADNCRVCNNMIRDGSTGVDLANSPENTQVQYNRFDNMTDDTTGTTGAGSTVSDNFSA